MVIRDVTDDKKLLFFLLFPPLFRTQNLLHQNSQIQWIAHTLRKLSQFLQGANIGYNIKTTKSMTMLNFASHEEVSGEEYDRQSSTSSSTTPTFQNKLTRNKLATQWEILETLDNYHYIYMNISNSLLNKYFFEVRRLSPNYYFWSHHFSKLCQSIFSSALLHFTFSAKCPFHSLIDAKGSNPADTGRISKSIA